MAFSDDFLRALTNRQVQGDFPPFTLGNQSKIENYLRKIVAELQRHAAWQVEADFAHNGSGYASYVAISIIKKDRSDVVTITRGKRTYTCTIGLLLFASRLAPYWFYGGHEWLHTNEAGLEAAEPGVFLEPEEYREINPAVWQAEQYWLETIFTSFRYALLTPTELEQPAPAAIKYIPTVLADPPYRVFDCFFYWMD